MPAFMFNIGDFVIANNADDGGGGVETRTPGTVGSRCRDPLMFHEDWADIDFDDPNYLLSIEDGRYTDDNSLLFYEVLYNPPIVDETGHTYRQLTFGEHELTLFNRPKRTTKFGAFIRSIEEENATGSTDIL